MNFWLFKTEPGCFSYSDLLNRPARTEHWDGVRNFQARNFLRDQVQVGDGVLFYHSNIPEPAVIGTARVVRAGYPDWTAWDPAGGHFYPKSGPDRPIWYMVDVQAEQVFIKPVPLSLIKSHPGLGGMVLLTRSRLSIQPVTGDEWRMICQLGGISAAP